jgi:predicted AlkP superfamily pyrophosphatase or phosphodiesterase
LFTGGSPLFMLHMGLRYRKLLKNLEYFHLDNFNTAVASDLIRKRKTNLLLLHLLDLDGTRHRFGFRAPETAAVLEDHDRRLGNLLAAARNSGAIEDTTFVVFGDHAYIDVHTRIRVNAAFRKAGLLVFDRAGKLIRWDAWANCCGGSAQVALRDPADLAVHDRIAAVFTELQDGGAVEAVCGPDPIRRMKLGGRIDYVLEAETGFYFVPEVDGETIVPGKESFRATHGYHPYHPGYSSPFIAAGAGIRTNVQLQSFPIVDMGPTLASLLGCELPDAEGRVLQEILDLG